MKLTDDKVHIFGLCINCPDGKPVKSCVFEECRKKGIIEKMDFVKELPPDEVKQLLQAHKKCLRKRVRDKVYSDSI